MPLTLEDSARLAGGHCWVERRLFEITGGWVSSTPETEVKLMLDRHSQHHAWRALQWWDRLPVLDDVERDALVAAPGPAVAAVLTTLTEVRTTIPRLAGLYRVALARIHVSYRNHRALAGPVADGSTMRTLDIVGPDVLGDWTEGEAVLQSLLVSRPGVEDAASIVSHLEGILAE